jgi:hypothetical protein
MKQTKHLSMLFVCVLMAIGSMTVSAQSASIQSSKSEKISGEAAKQQYYLNRKVDNTKPLTAAEYEQQKSQHTVVQKKLIPSAGNRPLRTGEAPVISRSADRKQTLLDLRAAAAAKGLPTAKYDLELQNLHN